jgi:hypothetical protein
MDTTQMRPFVCGTPFVNNTTPPAKEAVFRAELSKLPLHERARKIDEKLRETQASLNSRDERLLSLRPAFDRLTLDFLHEARPPKTRRKWNHPIRNIVATLLLIGVIFLVVYGLASTGNTGMAGIMAVLGFGILCFTICNLLIQPPANNQEGQLDPFWLTGGAIALSNLGITPPAGAKWWWSGRTAFVFPQHLSVRFSVDAHTGQVIWSSTFLSSELEAPKAAEILGRLISSTPAYRQLVNSFDASQGWRTNSHSCRT